MHIACCDPLNFKQRTTTHAFRSRYGTSVKCARHPSLQLLLQRRSYAGATSGTAHRHCWFGRSAISATGETSFLRRFTPPVRATAPDSLQVTASSPMESAEGNAGPRDKVSAACQHYPLCGGCTCQEVAYQAQLAAKQDLVVSLFRRHASMDVAGNFWQQIRGCQQQYRYRNKMCFTSDKTTLGLYYRDRKELLRIHDCHLQDETANLILQQVNNMRLYAHIEALTIRWAQASKDPSSRKYMAILHARSALPKKAARKQTQQKPPPRRLLTAAEQMRAHVPDLASVILRSGVTRHDWLNSSTNETLLAGHPYLMHQLCGLQFKISPASFFQTNPAQAEVLYGLVIAAAGLRPTDTALDLFCGIGTITLALARHCKAVIGVEASSAAVADAKHNAQANAISNAAFWQADLSSASAVAGIAGQLPPVDVVIADPARAGLDAAVKGFLCTCQARTMVYVSCNPATQARDTAELCKHGYRVVSVQPCDMFPHTAHIENIVVLSSVGSNSSEA